MDDELPQASPSEAQRGRGGFPTGPDAVVGDNRASINNVVQIPAAVRSGPSLILSRPRLMSCSLELHRFDAAVNAFYASVVRDERVFTRRVLERFGPTAFENARVARGADWGNAIADMMVSDAVEDMLAAAAADPAGELAQGFEVSLEVGFLQ